MTDLHFINKDNTLSEIESEALIEQLEQEIEDEELEIGSSISRREENLRPISDHIEENMSDVETSYDQIVLKENDETVIDDMRKEESREQMLEYINLQIIQLKERNKDVSYFMLAPDASYDEIKQVWNTLYKRNTSESLKRLISNGIVFGAKIVEKIFNGEREILGFCPNMTGWSKNVNLKLADMDIQLSSLSTQVMRKHNYSQNSGIIGELLLGGFIYGMSNDGKRYARKNENIDDNNWKTC